jgi:hypothetical protein
MVFISLESKTRGLAAQSSQIWRQPSGMARAPRGAKASENLRRGIDDNELSHSGVFHIIDLAAFGNHRSDDVRLWPLCLHKARDTKAHA